MWSIPALAITEVERGELERRVRAKTASQREAQRARIVLLAAEGVPNRRIAAEVAMSEEYVGLWRRRFAEKRLEPRPSRQLNDV
jgi:transposase